MEAATSILTLGMDADTKAFRPVIKQPIADGAVAAEGKGQGMRYAMV